MAGLNQELARANGRAFPVRREFPILSLALLSLVGRLIERAAGVNPSKIRGDARTLVE